jgi:hypothetical protein
MLASIVLGSAFALQLLGTASADITIPLRHDHPGSHGALQAQTAGKMMNVSTTPTYVTLPSGMYDKVHPRRSLILQYSQPW